MYCPRCRIETEDMFCENCGGTTVLCEEAIDTLTKAKATIPYPTQEKIKANVEIAKFSIKKILSSLVIASIIVGVLIGYNILKEQYTPRKAVQKYYDYLANSDYDNAYKMLVDTDDNFLSKEVYISSMNQQDFKQYTIKNYNPNDFKQIYDFSDSQNINISSSDNMFSVQAGGKLYPVSVVNMGKKLLFFNDYKINADNFTIKWQFISPLGSKISVLGKEPVKSNEPNIGKNFMLSDLYKPSSVTYEIGHIFSGNYDITATMEGAKEVKYSGVASGKNVNIKFEPTEELVKQLQDEAKSFLDLYYANSSKEKYASLLSKDSDVLTKVTTFSIYKNKQVINKSEDINVVKQSIDDINHANISVKYKLNYDDNSLIIWGGDKQTGTKESTTDFYFEKQDGKWLIVDIGYIN